MSRDYQLPVSTERVTLRALCDNDLAAHQELFGDPAVVRYLYDNVVGPDQALEHFTRRHSKLPEEGEWCNLAVEADGAFIGEVGLSLRSKVHRQCEVGYVFRRDSGGRGLATEAVACMVEVAFSCLNAHRVEGRLDARNQRSAALLERLGFRREGQLVENEFVKGEWTDEAIYALRADEWTAPVTISFAAAIAT